MNRELIQWGPFHNLAGLQARFDRLFGDSFGRPCGDLGETLERSSWAPAVDIHETSDALVLRADLPGVDPKDVDIQVENNTLTLRGERKFESDVKEENYQRVERVYGSFVRSFTLPRTVDADKVEAAYRHGVLEVRLPKKPEAKPRQMNVAVTN